MNAPENTPAAPPVPLPVVPEGVVHTFPVGDAHTVRAATEAAERARLRPQPAGEPPSAEDVALWWDTLFDTEECWVLVAAMQDRATWNELPPLTWPAQREAALAFATTEPSGRWEAYVCPHPRPVGEGRRTKGNALGRLFVQADVDGGIFTEADLRARVDVPGMFAVASGSPGACHVYLPTADEMNAAEHEALCRALRAVLGGPARDGGPARKVDAKVTDEGVLRPVGSVNHKDPFAPVYVRWLVRPDGAAPLLAESLADELGVDLTGAAARVADAAARIEANAWGAGPVGPDGEPLVTLALAPGDPRVRALSNVEMTGDRSADTYAVVVAGYKAGLDPVACLALVESFPDLKARLDEKNGHHRRRDDVGQCWLKAQRENGVWTMDPFGFGTEGKFTCIAPVGRGRRAEVQASLSHVAASAAPEPAAGAVPHIPSQRDGAATDGAAGAASVDEDADEEPRGVGPGGLFADLTGDRAPAAVPECLVRTDGFGVFYRGAVNFVFGDPACGKTMVIFAAIAESLGRGERCAFVDVDHNGLDGIVDRLATFGVPADVYGDPERFLYVEPESADHLLAVVAALVAWLGEPGAVPGVVGIDSVGEVLPMLGLKSNDGDDYTNANRAVFRPIKKAGAALIVADHLPKDRDVAKLGPGGSYAKKRTIDGASYRVLASPAFVKGRGGKAVLVLDKDRHSGTRARPGETVAPLALGVDPLLGATWTVLAPKAKADGDADTTPVKDQPPTAGELADLDARILAFVRAGANLVSGDAISKGVTGRKADTLARVALLAENGVLARHAGGRGGGVRYGVAADSGNGA